MLNIYFQSCVHFTILKQTLLNTTIVWSWKKSSNKYLSRHAASVNAHTIQVISTFPCIKSITPTTSMLIKWCQNACWGSKDTSKHTHTGCNLSLTWFHTPAVPLYKIPLMCCITSSGSNLPTGICESEVQRLDASKLCAAQPSYHSDTKLINRTLFYVPSSSVLFNLQNLDYCISDIQLDLTRPHVPKLSHYRQLLQFKKYQSFRYLNYR